MSKWRKFPKVSVSPGAARRREVLRESKELASALMARNEMEEALDLLEPLAEEFGRDAELHMMLGVCYYGVGEPALAVEHYEQARALDKDAAILYPLGIAYLEVGLVSSALDAFEESQRRGCPLPPEAQPVLSELRQELGKIAGKAGLPLAKALPGLRAMEQGLQYTAQDDYHRAAGAYRAAIKVCGAWAVPHNNLAFVLFFDGQLAAALSETRQVLAREPENINAACNLVRFLAWSGDTEGAQEVWQALRLRVPEVLPADAIKLGETAAVMEDDASVHRLLLPLGKLPPEEIGGSPLHVFVQRALATAEANLGNVKAAKRRLHTLPDEEDELVEVLLEALSEGSTGLGLRARFPYFQGIDMVPLAVAAECERLVRSAGIGGDPRLAKEIKRLAARYPQLAVMGEKAIWEEDAVEFGISVLQHLGTPAAQAALRHFAFSQAGSDEERMRALLALQVSGGLQVGEVVQMWRAGAWHETRGVSLSIEGAQARPRYAAKVNKLLEQGEAAVAAEEYEQAVTLLRQAIALEPRAMRAYNNLALALASRGDRAGSREAFAQALAIDPDYVYARVNLALQLLDEDAAAAAALMQPLRKRTAFMPGEYVAYQYGLARFAFAQANYDAAHGLLTLALAVDPAYAPAQMLLDSVEKLQFGEEMGRVMAEFGERFEESNAQYRRRQQAKLKSLAPAVAEVIDVYSAELLRAMAQAIAPARSLTGLRKAGLQQLVREAVRAPSTLARLVNEDLRDGERAALRAVLAAGGAMPQQEFRAAYGDDAGESPWWLHAPPASVAGRLRLRGLLAETTVKGVVYLAVPAELRGPLADLLGADPPARA